jgi:hypothetical protein
MGADITGKTCAASENAFYCFQPSSDMIASTNSIVSKEDQVHDEGTGIKQTSTGVDQMVLLPLRTLRALPSEVAELRGMFVMFKKDTTKQLESYGDALNVRLSFGEIGANALDGGDDRSTQVDLVGLAARKVAVKRVRRLPGTTTAAKGALTSNSWLMLEKPKVDNHFVQVASPLQRLNRDGSFPSATAFKPFLIPRYEPTSGNASRNTVLPSCGDVHMRVIMRSRNL